MAYFFTFLQKLLNLTFLAPYNSVKVMKALLLFSLPIFPELHQGRLVPKSQLQWYIVLAVLERVMGSMAPIQQC